MRALGMWPSGVTLFALSLAAPVALAAPGQNDGYQQIDHRYTDGRLNDGKHGFFLSLGSDSTFIHGYVPGTAEQNVAMALANEFVKADIRFFGAQQVLVDAFVESSAIRTGASLAAARTCAKGRFLVMGTEVLDSRGRCDARSLDMLTGDGNEISKTFYRKSGSVSVAFVDISVELAAQGTVGFNYEAESRNSNARDGVASVGFKAYGSLEAKGKIKGGVDLVASAEIVGTVKLVDISFSPQMFAGRRYDPRLPVAERASYALGAYAPVTLSGLDGKVEVAVEVNPTVIIPTILLPVEIEVARAVVWDPAPLIRLNTTLVNRTASEGFAANFGI